ncbi:MAG: DUF2062 domain-containing protein [Devosiaceae bacterium]|nr:DUF2062 domain-containing protein [Devosiaceae bacterium MH13]
MLFKRRNSPPWHERARLMLWPRRSFVRSSRYALKRIVRVNATPYAIAVGVACGAFVSFTPLLGVHFLLAFILAWMFGGNLIAAALGTFVGNPLTFPLIWALTYRVGRVMLGRPVFSSTQPPLADLEKPGELSVESVSGFFEQIWPAMKPMLIGSVPIGLTAAAACFGLTYWAVLGYQRARRAQLERGRQARAAALAEMGEKP